VNENPNLQGMQFNYRPPEMGRSSHHLSVTMGDQTAGMEWNAKHIMNISVPEGIQRQGVGSALWNEGHRLASENARIPAPAHSADRTNAGDAWARRVGGRLPRRSQSDMPAPTPRRRDDDTLVM
jgi:hypothetical protein